MTWLVCQVGVRFNYDLFSPWASAATLSRRVPKLINTLLINFPSTRSEKKRRGAAPVTNAEAETMKINFLKQL
jgi:hypothetical protein